MAGPLTLSVVIANYNRLDWLQKCLSALEAQPAGMQDRFEVVLVDDGSAAPVVDYIKAYAPNYKFTYILQKNRGPAVARNRGTEAAAGDYIAYIDNDSVAPQDWMERAFEAIAMIKGKVVGINGRIIPYPSEAAATQFAGTLETISEQSLLGRLLYPYNKGNTNNLIYAKKPVLDVGGFDEGYPYPAFEDADLAFRLAKKGLVLGDYDRLRIFHPNETEWKILKKKFVMHGVSVRRFTSKFIFRYPFSVLFILAVNFWALALFLPISPLFIIGGKASAWQARFLRSWYTFQGLLKGRVAFQSKNS